MSLTHFDQYLPCSVAPTTYLLIVTYTMKHAFTPIFSRKVKVYLWQAQGLGQEQAHDQSLNKESNGDVGAELLNMGKIEM